MGEAMFATAPSLGIARQFRLSARPTGLPKESDFTLSVTPLPEVRGPGAGFKTVYLSVDPYMRGRITGVRTYADPRISATRWWAPQWDK